MMPVGRVGGACAVQSGVENVTTRYRTQPGPGWPAAIRPFTRLLWDAATLAVHARHFRPLAGRR